jgi:hypothetical protein
VSSHGFRGLKSDTGLAVFQGTLVPLKPYKTAFLSGSCSITEVIEQRYSLRYGGQK